MVCLSYHYNASIYILKSYQREICIIGEKMKLQLFSLTDTDLEDHHMKVTSFLIQ